MAKHDFTNNGKHAGAIAGVINGAFEVSSNQGLKRGWEKPPTAEKKMNYPVHNFNMQ